MDWLKDKKNQPIIALILAVVIVGGLVFVWMRMKGPDQGGPSTTAQTDTTPMTSEPPVSPIPTETPAAEPPQGPVPDVFAAAPMETWRKDPFLPVGYKPPKKGPKPQPPIRDFPFFKFPPPPKPVEEDVLPEPPQPTRRMAGILLNERVYAIIETNGRSQIVQPGDTLEDRLAKVEKIEADKVILKTLSKNPRYLVVRMAAAPRSTSSASSTSTSSYPDGSSADRMRGRRGSMPMPGGPPIPGPM